MLPRYNDLPMPGVIDYRLARRALLADYRRGLAGLSDICDAHPELLRAAKNIGRKLEQRCPVCRTGELREVSYVFGDELKGYSGRVVYPEGWVEELQERYEEFRCYSVEVCIDCCWNHLSACYLLGRRHSRPQAASAR